MSRCDFEGVYGGSIEGSGRGGGQFLIQCRGCKSLSMCVRVGLYSTLL